MGQYLAASLMFIITIGFTAIFCFPALKVIPKDQLVKFYWIGFWVFPGGLAALSGAQAVLLILDQDVETFAAATQVGITCAFVAFVMFAWGRLTLKGLTTLAKSKK